MRPPRRSALAIVGISVLAFGASACRPDTAPPSGREALAGAVADTLPFQGRLSGGFVPSKRGPTRAAGDRAAELSPDTRIAIALLEKRAIETPTPEAFADLGVGYLVQGDIDRAITTIEDAASQMTAAAPWSDLSAAYLAKAERTPTRRVEYLARALEAAEKSLKISKSNDALFNRALARDGLAPFTGSPAPWSEYTASEHDRGWRDAASRMASDDRAVDDVRDRWNARLTELPGRLQQSDQAFVEETVRLFPEASIEYLEQELLGDPLASDSASQLAAAIFRVTRDPMARDEVNAVRLRGVSLTRAHQAYATAQSRYDANQHAEARELFTAAAAGFASTQAPYLAWAQLQLAAMDWREGQFDRAQGALEALERTARARNYTTLLGSVLSRRGLVFNRQWRLTEALAAFRESASLYESAGQIENALAMYSSMADALRMIGEAQESWRSIGRTLEGLSHVRKPNRRYLFLYNAALFAGRQNLDEAALLFQDAAIQQAQLAGADVLAEALVQRALVNVRRSDFARARADIEHAARQIASTQTRSFRDYMNAEIEIVRAQLSGGDPSSNRNLHSAITFFSRIEPGRVPGLYLLLARSAQTRASRVQTETALRSGIEALEARQADLGDEALRISYFDDSWALFQDMIALQVASDDRARAFDYAERSRARSLLSAAQGSVASRTRALAVIQAQLPPSTVLVHYSTLADRVLIWTLTRSTAALTQRQIRERDLFRLIEQHRASIRERRDNRDVNDRLYSLLVQPALPAMADAAAVVLIPDGQLQQLPFATLRNPATRKYFVEDHPLLVSPSASFFVDARASAGPRSSAPLQSALLVGNPSGEGVRSLPGAEAEVAAASRLYARHQVLLGRAATKERFLEVAPSFDVVHFGGHALVNPEFPLLSRLVFAGAEAEQSLFAHEIARVRFPRTQVVVLAACSTAAGPVSRGEGVLGVARPFLAGGVPLVIASQWDVDDRATAQLTLVFHRELAMSGDPIRALQSAQLALLRSGDAVLALPENWGAFVAVGTSARQAGG